VPAQAARYDEADLALLEEVGGAVADARLGPCVGRRPEPERTLVEVRRLLRVADPELDVIPALERHEVGRGHASDLTPRHARIPAWRESSTPKARTSRRSAGSATSTDGASSSSAVATAGGPSASGATRGQSWPSTRTRD